MAFSIHSRFNAALIGAGLVAILLAGCATPPPVAQIQLNNPLRQEILGMLAEDQRVRQNYGPNMDVLRTTEMQQVDAHNEARLKEIIAQYGWPGRSLVGEGGANAVWLMVQHGDTDFMVACVPLMQESVKAGEASLPNYVFLLDRALVRQGRPQVFGTQFHLTQEGQLVCDPVQEPEHLDDRRKNVGFSPMAVYEAQMRKSYNLPPK